MIAKLLLEATLDTLYMTFVSTFLAFIIGLGLAIILVITGKNGLKPNKAIYNALDIIVNTLRSFPFIILIIVLFVGGNLLEAEAKNKDLRSRELKH